MQRGKTWRRNAVFYPAGLQERMRGCSVPPARPFLLAAPALALAHFAMPSLAADIFLRCIFPTARAVGAQCCANNGGPHRRLRPGHGGRSAASAGAAYAACLHHLLCRRLPKRVCLPWDCKRSRHNRQASAAGVAEILQNRRFFCAGMAGTRFLSADQAERGLKSCAPWRAERVLQALNAAPRPEHASVKSAPVAPPSATGGFCNITAAFQKADARVFFSLALFIHVPCVCACPCLTATALLRQSMPHAIG